MTNKKQTSSDVTSKASKILRDNCFSGTSKSIDESALSQTKMSKSGSKTNSKKR